MRQSGQSDLIDRTLPTDRSDRTLPTTLPTDLIDRTLPTDRSDPRLRSDRRLRTPRTCPGWFGAGG